MADSGSWKIIAIRLPRSDRTYSASRVSRSTPSRKISPLRVLPCPAWALRVCFAVGRRCRPITARLVTLLPDPDSPTMPSVRPAFDPEAQAVDGLDQTVVGAEVHPQVTDVQERAVVARATGGRSCSTVSVIPTSPSGRPRRRADRRSDWPRSRTPRPPASPPRSWAGRWPRCRRRRTCPRPLRENVFSVSTAPPSSRPTSRPKMVRIGVSAARRPCLTTTVCSGRPLARAVRM